MKRILVPCDFSKPSNEAYKVAIDLARKLKAEIILLHVLATPALYSAGFAGEAVTFNPVFFAELEDMVKKQLEKMKSRAAVKAVKVSTKVEFGALVSTITSVIEKTKSSLIIMGTSGASGLAEIFIGSNTEKVVRFSPVPVLTVKKAIGLKSIKNILVPSTLELNQTDFIKKVKQLQKLFDATLHVLLINTPTHFRYDAVANEELREFAKHYKLTNYKLHFSNYAREEDGIIEFAYSEGMDLIAMATHARKGLAHLFNSSVTENIVNHIKSPIWTCHLKA